MPAGRFDDGLYSTRVNEFNWADFFDRYPLAITEFAYHLRENYNYILVDSRTGYTDISGICTSVMPEKLVTVFTPNRQSISGVIEMINSAAEYRKQSNDLRPLLVFPLQSRIENAEDKLKREWRSDREKGYQPKLESVLKQVYDLEECDLQKYFNLYKLPYVPKYSYGESLAVLEEDYDDTSSLAYEFNKFADKLISDETPWEEAVDTISEVNFNLKRLQRSSASTSQNIYQTGMAFFFAVLAFFLYYFGSSSGLFQVLYDTIHWQYFNIAIIIWLTFDFLWVRRWKSVIERSTKLLNKPWVFTEDNTPQNVSVYPRILLENFATFSVQNFNFRFGKKINSSDQPWSRFFNSLSSIVFNPEHPSSTLGNIFSLFLFVSFTLASSIVISNTLSEIGLVSSNLPSIFQRLDYPLLAGTILSFATGIWMFMELAGISKVLDINKSDVRKNQFLGAVAAIVGFLSFLTMTGITLKQISFLVNSFGMSNIFFTEAIAVSLPVITTSFGAVLVFESAVRGFITILYFLLMAFLVLLPVLAFLVDISWRTIYITLDFLQWLLLTPILILPHLLFGIYPADEEKIKS